MAARRRRPKQPSGNPRERLVAAALDLATERGWRRVGLADIAAAAGLSLEETYGLVRSKHGIIAALRRQTDRAMLRGRVATGESPRERLFEVLMRRYEALQPYRVGLRAVLRDSIATPGVIFFVPGLLRSMGWTLSAAGLPAYGCRGRLARRLLAGIYVSLLPTFFQDESRDLGTTMAALDRRLRQVESMLTVLGPLASAGRRA